MLCLWLMACGLVLYAQKPQPDPEGMLVYSLPATSLVLEVEAVQENFYAGPYAKYAAKYLGIEARQKDSRSYTISRVGMKPYVEADQGCRYVVLDPLWPVCQFACKHVRWLVQHSRCAAIEGK